MEKQVAIIGAGVSGLLACKYSLEKHLNPVLFEAEEVIGGVWAHTIKSTKLQSTKEIYHFSDFPWPSSIKEACPSHNQVLDYFESYARQFNLYPYIKFNSRVNGIDYVGGESDEEMESWDLWGGTGKPFGSKGKWHIKVQDMKNNTTMDYQAEFVILCVGRFSGLPNIPEFPPGRGPEVFNGKVLHSIDYSFMDKLSAENLIRKKKVAVVGSNKSAVDIATECANANGVDYPCTLILRTVHWLLPHDFIPKHGYMFFIRFKDLMFHKPGETFLQGTLATVLSPMRWLASKLVESYLRSLLPLKKYGLIPEENVFQQFDSCTFSVLSEHFCNRVEEGSIVLKKSQRFSFCKEGLLIDDEGQPLKVDVVIFATGFKGDEKLRNIFVSPRFQQLIMGSPAASIVPLYRHIIHPRIPRLAVIGYAESFSNLFTSELKCQWLAQLLDGKFQVPSIRVMEKDVEIWGQYLKKVDGKYFRKSCIGSCILWYNDQLCKDMGRNPRRKKGLWADFFSPYAASDYADLTH